ncbi:hypothetical protein [Frigoriglobus tundricola]|uniref:Uncharacterized protein n=1 Tax=Frigoriglobus tundricola TaxID=2774151 RepID=A0A6M5YGQ7_9BACT|nr:hypothetical protein [Frigoriglobus tundricola]QJW92531.1 hypothetical protein FTUN_0027 [Frigoriglobus tundricola]
MAGTRVGRWVNGVWIGERIEAVRLGQNVPTWRPGEWGYAASGAAPGTAFAPDTHRAVWLRQERADGTWTEAGLLRSRDWMRAQGGSRVGDRTVLELPEMGVSGVFQVVAVDPCPEIEAGPGGCKTGYVSGRRSPLEWGPGTSGEVLIEPFIVA